MIDKRLGSPLAALALLAALVAGFALFHRAAPAQESSPAAQATLTEADWPLSATEKRGRVVYGKYCIGCHGVEGRGDGPASQFLAPLPRDFQSGQFKFRSTPFGQPPLETDLLRTVTCGLPGSSMPGFPLVPEIERKDVVRYVLHLAKLGRANRRLAYAIREEDATIETFRTERLPALRAEIDADEPKRIVVPAETARDDESVARGRALFATSCAACHGARGVGDGPSAWALRDDRRGVIRPRDFTSGVFRSGSTPEDVYVRIRTGLSGTPMPGFSNLPETDVWDLVHFIESLKDPAAEKPRMAPGCGHEGDDR